MPKQIRIFCQAVTLLAYSGFAESGQTTTVYAKKPQRAQGLAKAVFKDDETPSLQRERWNSLSAITLKQNGDFADSYEVYFRGLSNSRLNLSLEGAPLNDPGSGLLDPHDLPLWLQGSLEQSTSSLSLEALDLKLAEPTVSRAQFSLAAGSFGLGIVRAHSTMVFSPETHDFTLASQFITSKGDFAYLPGPQIRTNNDQQRVQLFTRWRYNTSQFRNSVLALFNVHQGGIPPHWRIARTSGMALLNSEWRLEPAIFVWSLQTQFNFRQTREPDKSEESDMSFWAHRVSQEIRPTLSIPTLMPSWKSYAQAIYHATKPIRRVILGTQAQVVSNWPLIFKPQTVFAFNLDGISEVGTLWGALGSLSIKPYYFWEAGFRAKRSVRPPTLSEIYAPMGLVLGNPSLAPESLVDFSFFSNVCVDRLSLSGTVFFGVIDNAIRYVGVTQDQFKPVNIDTADRFGFDLNSSWEALDWLQLHMGTGWVWTHVHATNTPLPNVPPWTIQAGTRIGLKEGFHGLLDFRFRDKTSDSPTYSMFNLAVRAPVNAYLKLFFEIRNIFDIQWARDDAYSPLPGQSWLAGMELSS